MSIAYISGTTWESATACSLPVFTAPIAGVNLDYVLEQDFMIRAVNYLPLALNTPHADYPTFILVEEGPRRDVSGNVFRWTRKYAKVPQTYSQPQGFQYAFVGYLTTGTPNTTGRARTTIAVSGRLQFDYFLLDEVSGNILDANATVVFNGTAGVLPSIVNVPILNPKLYFGSGIGDVKFGIESDFIAYGPSAAVPQINYPTPNPADTNYPPYAAYPTREVYESWRDQTATVTTWNPATNTMTDTGLYEIVAQGSQCLRWLGNIIERQTLYIRPQ